jgi:hypothetical protein
MRQTIFQPLFQATDSFRLIAGGTKSGIQFERFTHGRLPDEGMSGRKVILLTTADLPIKNTGCKNSGIIRNILLTGRHDEHTSKIIWDGIKHQQKRVIPRTFPFNICQAGNESFMAGDRFLTRIAFI